MEGIYKSKLDEEQLNRVILQVFGCAIRTSSELSEGWANSAYIIELEDSRRVVLKARPPTDTQFMRCEIDTMKTEVAAMKQLATIEQLPIPRIYIHDDSLTLLPVEYFIMEYLEGSSYSQVKASLTDDDKEKIEHQLGVLSRVINEVKGESFGLFSQAVFPSWKESFRDMMFGLLEDGKAAGVTLPITYPELEHEIEIRLDVLDEVKEPRLVHWDLWDGNVFVKDGEITGLIDFERALWGDPLMEFYFGHFTPSPAFRQGYGLFLTEPSEIARRELYDLYLNLILYIECAYRKYDSQDHVKWTLDNLVAGLERFRNSEIIRKS